MGLEVEGGQLSGEVSRGALGGDQREAEQQLHRIARLEGQQHHVARGRGLRHRVRAIGAQLEEDPVAPEAVAHLTQEHEASAQRGGIDLGEGLLGHSAGRQRAGEIEHHVRSVAVGKRVAVVGGVSGGGELGLHAPFLQGHRVAAG